MRRLSSHFRHTYAPLVLTLPVYLRAAHTHTSGILTHRSSSHIRRTYVQLVLTLQTYLRATRTYTSSVLTRRSYSHALHGFIVLAVSVTPGVLFVVSVLTRSA